MKPADNIVKVYNDDSSVWINQSSISSLPSNIIKGGRTEPSIEIKIFYYNKRVAKKKSKFFFFDNIIYHHCFNIPLVF